MMEELLENEMTTEPAPLPPEEGIEGESADTPIEPTESADGDATEEAVDYAALAAEDLAALKAQFPALREISSLAALPDPVRYAELREMGLSPKEAYLATGGTARSRTDNRAHLLSAVPRQGALAENLPTAEQMAEARRLFSNLSDAQIHRLYQKVTN